jgi:hypothetical protein
MTFRRVLASLVLALSLPAGAAAAASPAPPAGLTARDDQRSISGAGAPAIQRFQNCIFAHRFLAIKDMGHQFNLMTPAHVETQLVEIEKFLTTECGPGGL